MFKAAEVETETIRAASTAMQRTVWFLRLARRPLEFRVSQCPLLWSHCAFRGITASQTATAQHGLISFSSSVCLHCLIFGSLTNSSRYNKFCCLGRFYFRKRTVLDRCILDVWQHNLLNNLQSQFPGMIHQHSIRSGFHCVKWDM